MSKSLILKRLKDIRKMIKNGKILKKRDLGS